MSLSPDGFSLAVAFSDSALRIFHILAKGLQIFKEYKLIGLKNLVKYSHFGGYLAVGFGNKVGIFSTTVDCL